MRGTLLAFAAVLQLAVSAGGSVVQLGTERFAGASIPGYFSTQRESGTKNTDAIMLRIIQNSSAAGAKSYYSTADYYAEGQQELAGQWRGEGATRLGLSGEVKKEAWDALCDNRNPDTGRSLTVRRKQERRVGYDFNFHVPKSLSVLYSLSPDERLLEAFQESVDETMTEMEAEMKTRVRKGGKNEDRTTGNMIWGEFTHFTSRPVDGIPDPHLHAHCFVFNCTWDEKESRWKSGQFADLKRDAPYFEAVFHSKLSRKVADLGIAVDRTKNGWEIAGIPNSITAKFSRRTALIEEMAKEKGITDPQEKEKLGAKSRQRKVKNLSMEELRQEWRSRLDADEQSWLDQVGRQLGGKAIGEEQTAANQAMTLALDHCLERKSVVPEREVLREALKLGMGKASRENVEAEFSNRDLIRAERQGRRFVTTPMVLAEEKKMIDFARQGRGTRPQFGDPTHPFKRQWLNEGQRKAVVHVLGSRDRVILIRGAAGVGKTSMMQEAVEAIEAGGKKVFAFAPSADASRGVLRQEGFGNADTVARLLLDEKLQEQVKGQLIWIDEAGLLGTKTTAQVFDLADKLDARIVLSGDRRQHGSVERGAALRLLETEAGLIPAEIKEIQRQKGAYKQAVAALSEGRIEDGFRQFDKLGWIRQVESADRYKILASDYIAAVAEGKTALVVSPTHQEGHRITDAIRAGLKEMGRIQPNERRFQTLQNANLTQAERADAVNYRPGDVVIFHQNAKGYKRGQKLIVGEGSVPVDQTERFQAYHANRLSIAPGDILRITANGKTADGLHRLNNGAMYSVKAFNSDGDIVLNNNWIVLKDFGHLAHGFCVTSHASQGKTVDRVLIGQSAESFPASSREQFYVSISRGREQATVYTNDRESLLEAVSHSDERLTATECFGANRKRQRVSVMQRLKQLADVRPEAAREAHRSRELAYER